MDLDSYSKTECPFCGDNEPEEIGLNQDWENEEFVVKVFMECYQCEAEWVEKYTLSAVERLNGEKP